MLKASDEGVYRAVPRRATAESGRFASDGARRPVLAGDIAQALGQLAEQGGNLDPLAGAGAAVALAGAVLEILAALVLDVA